MSNFFSAQSPHGGKWDMNGFSSYGSADVTASIVANMKEISDQYGKPYMQVELGGRADGVSSAKAAPQAYVTASKSNGVQGLLYWEPEVSSPFTCYNGGAWDSSTSEPTAIMNGFTTGDTVTNPGDQSGTADTAISGVQIHATDPASGQTLTYSAAGLPPALPISSSGLISSTPATLRNYSVTVTAKDPAGASGSAVFTWTVSGGSGTQVAYPKASEWPGGFTANVTITNNGTSTLNGWTVAWAFPGDQKLTNADQPSGTAPRSGWAVVCRRSADGPARRPHRRG
jgi:Cellulose binding domain/Putative Ig domain